MEQQLEEEDSTVWLYWGKILAQRAALNEFSRWSTPQHGKTLILP